MKDIIAVGIAVSLGLLALFAPGAAGCGSLPKPIADAMKDLALEVCVDADSMSVCAKKCADESAKRELAVDHEEK